jgi:hypothetical protein
MTVEVFFKVEVDFIINPKEPVDKFNDLCSHITETYGDDDNSSFNDVFHVSDKRGAVIVEFYNISDAIKADADVKAAIERFGFKVFTLE